MLWFLIKLYLFITIGIPLLYGLFLGLASGLTARPPETRLSKELG